MDYKKEEEEKEEGEGGAGGGGRDEVGKGVGEGSREWTSSYLIVHIFKILKNTEK